MKVSKTIKKVTLVTAIIFLTVGLLISIAQLSFPFLIKHYKIDLEHMVQQRLHQPIQVGSITTAWHHMTLLLKLHNVQIFDKKDANTSIKVQEIKIGLNPWMALIKRQYIPTVIVLRGTHLVLRQQADNSVQLEGLNITPDTEKKPNFAEIMALLAAERHLVLQNIDIDWYDKNGERYNLNDINAEMRNKKNRYRLWGKLTIIPFSQISQEKGINLIFNIKGRGNWQQKNSLISKAYLKVDNLALNQWQNKLHFLKLQKLNGLVGTEIWSEWQGEQLLHLKSIFNLKDIQIVESASATVVAVQAAHGTLAWNHGADINNCPTIQYLGVEKMPSCHNNQIALALEGQGAEFNCKNLFAKPVPLDQFQTQLYWQQQGPKSQLTVNNFSILSRDMKVQGQLKLIVPLSHVPTGEGLGKGPEIRLLAGVSGADAKYLADYLPVGILKPNLTTWLINSIKSGHSPYGTLLLHGPLSSYPFGNHDGTFVIHGDVENATLSYMEGWPLLEHINGNLVFEKQRMLITATAKTLGADVKKAQAIINDLSAKNLALEVNSNIAATLAQGQAFINASPLQHNLGKAFADIRMDGPITLDLGLHIPLRKDDEKIEVKGDLALKDNTLDLIKWQLPIQNLTGLLHFTERSVTAQGLQANLFKQPLLINMRTINQNSPEPITEVEIKGNVAAKLLKQQFQLTSLDWLKGGTAYNAVLRLPHGSRLPNSIKVTSSLKGVTIDFPEPLGKLANEALNTTLVADFLKTGNIDAKLEYGKQIAALVNFYKVKDKLKFKEAKVNLNTPMVAGEVIIPEKGKQIRAQLKHVHLAPSKNKETVLDQIEAKDIPPLDIRIEDFRYGEKRFGRSQIITEPTNRGLNIRQLNVDLGALRLSASGEWIDTAKLEKTSLKGHITSNDIAGALAAVGIPQLITASSGVMDFNLAWPGSPTDFELGHLNGGVDLQLAHGSIVDIGRSAAIKMNLGRILNLISLESFPKRLDFRFNNTAFRGFNFDSAEGGFTINDGQAVTDNTHIKGSMAAIAIRGRFGLATQDYDTYITVTPHIGTGLPLVATLVGGPIAGAVAWVANKVVSKGAEKIMTHTYHMTGSWKSPAVRKIGTSTDEEEDD